MTMAPLRRHQSNNFVREQKRWLFNIIKREGFTAQQFDRAKKIISEVLDAIKRGLPIQIGDLPIPPPGGRV